MKIREVNKNKKQFISLLLLADEQESMVDRYLEKGTMYVLEDNDVKAECVVTDEGNGILEIKNIAVDPENQGKGYGKALIDFLASKYADEYSVLQVGTGDSPLTIPFYEKCGFVRSHKIPNFFTDNYDHTIYEGGVQLLFSLMFGKKYVSVELEKENKYEVSGKNLKDFLDMIDSGQINEAENILLDSIDYTDRNEVMAAALFYQYLSEKDSEFLKNNNYTKEEVMSGFKQLLMQSGYTDLLCLVKAEE